MFNVFFLYSRKKKFVLLLENLSKTPFPMMVGLSLIPALYILSESLVLEPHSKCIMLREDEFRTIKSTTTSDEGPVEATHCRYFATTVARIQREYKSLKAPTSNC